MTESILNQLIVTHGVDQLIHQESFASLIMQLSPDTIEKELSSDHLSLINSRKQTALITRDHEQNIIATSKSYSESNK